MPVPLTGTNQNFRILIAILAIEFVDGHGVSDQ